MKTMFALFLAICVSTTFTTVVFSAAAPVDGISNTSPLPIDVPDFLHRAQAGTVTLNVGEEVLVLFVRERDVGLTDAKTFIVDESGRSEIILPDPFVFGGEVRGYPGSRVCLTVSSGSSWVRGYITYGDNWINIQPAHETPDKDGNWPHITYPTKGYSLAAERMQLARTGRLWSKSAAATKYLQTLVVGDDLYQNASTTHWYDRMVAHMNYVSDRLEVAIGVRMSVFSYSISHTLPVTTNSNTLLEEFGERYKQDSVQTRHLAHLLTGRKFTDGNLGLSMNSFGRCKGYSLIQTAPFGWYDGSDYQTMLLSLHEIGHNFHAKHELAASWYDFWSVCAQTAYSIMWPDFWGNCTAWTFSSANISAMETYYPLVFATGPLFSVSLKIADDATYTKVREVAVVPTIDFGPATRPVWGLSNAPDPNLDLICALGNPDTTWTLPAGDGLKHIYLKTIGDNDVTVETIGTITLDETPPSAVGNLASTSHTVGEPSAETQIVALWNAAVDATSGLAGYSVIWTEDPAAVPDDTIDLATAALTIVSPVLADGAWYFAIQARDNAGWNSSVQRIGPFNIDTVSGVGDDQDRLPERLVVTGLYPNPFNPNITVSFGLPQAGPAQIRIHDVSGRIVRTLLEEPLTSGWHTVRWNGRSDQGEELPSGMYFCRVQSGNSSVTKKMMLMK